MSSRSPFSVTRRHVLVGGVLIAGAGLAYGVRTPVASGPALTVAAAHDAAAAGEVLLIDIRRPDEWTRTGIGAGAQPLDMRRPDFEAALAALAGADRARPIALICARGVRSARLARRLAGAGFTGIVDVPEGMLGSAAGPGWLAEGLPTRLPGG